jgi:hypothetical protein
LEEYPSKPVGESKSLIVADSSPERRDRQFTGHLHDNADVSCAFPALEAPMSPAAKGAALGDNHSVGPPQLLLAIQTAKVMQDRRLGTLQWA